MRERALILAVVVLTVFGAAASPVAADDRPGGDGGAYVDPDDGDPTAVAEDGDTDGGGGGSGGGGGTEDPCYWRVSIEDDFEFAIYELDYTRLHSATGRWLERWCDGIGNAGVGEYFAVPEGGLADPYQLAVDALASVGIAPPAIRTSPSESGRLYVQVPTWLWLDRTWWQSYEATASAGRVWSTVRATPVATRWTLGDGDAVSCSGPGTPWRRGLSEDASTCSHIYRVSSASRPGGTFDLEATVTIEVSWTTNAPVGGGTLPAISRTSSLDVEVGEIQAIGTRGGQ